MKPFTQLSEPWRTRSGRLISPGVTPTSKRSTDPVRYLSVCSGIEAASVAWHPLGFTPVAFAEVEKFPSAVLANRWPGVPNLGDMTLIQGEKYRGQIDILVGGTPCQAFSVAGARRGLGDHRGNLTLVFGELANAIQPKFVVWENVPGVLSDKTNAFGCFLGLLAGEDDALVAPGGRWTDAGYVLGPERAIAWRILDAQYFGLAQRRRRVFLVACPRNGADPREILFEREGLRRDTAPRGEARPDITQSLTGCLGNGGADDNRAQGGFYVPGIAGSLGGGSGKRGWCNDLDSSGAFVALSLVSNGDAHSGFRDEHGLISHSLRGEGFDASEDGTGRGTPLVTVAFAQNQLGEVRTGEISETLNQNQNASGRNAPLVMSSQVRRLTPTECERLQGFTEIENYVRIRVWYSENQKKSALAGASNPRLRKSAWDAAGSVSLSSAEHAESGLNADPRRCAKPAAVSVRIDCERGVLQIRSRNGLNLSANIAESENSYPLRTPPAGFARLIALMPPIPGRTTLGGRVASRQSTRLSSHHQSGSVSVHLCGPEIEELAVGAEQFTTALGSFTRCITPEVGQNSQNIDLIWTIWSCSVASAIAGFIPETTPVESSFDILVKTTSPYTSIPWRGKPADQCPDGPRYKALGNSMAVPCMFWIGQRIKNAHYLSGL